MGKNFIDMAKSRYEELLKQREQIDRELKPLAKYLQNAGVMKASRRGRKPRSEKA